MSDDVSVLHNDLGTCRKRLELASQGERAALQEQEKAETKLAEYTAGEGGNCAKWETEMKR